MSLLAITKIVSGIVLLIFIGSTIRSLQQNGNGEYTGSAGCLMFLIAAESIALPAYGYLLMI